MSSKNNDTYNKLNDVEIKSIKLISDQGGSVEIHEDLVKTVSIYEDVFSPCLSGYIYIKDGQNLIEHFPIVGQETVEIKFRTPGIGSSIITVSFEVYSITDRIRSSNDKSEVYRLNLISKNYRLSELQRVKKPMSGKISDMVENVFAEYFESNTGYVIQKTHDDYKLIIPNLTPIETIRYLSTLAISEKTPRDSSFVLFESVDNYKFVSLNYLSSGNVYRKYTMKPTGIKDPSQDLLDKMFNIQDFEYQKGFNRIEDMKKGRYSSTMIGHDLITKKIKKQHYNYGSNFRQSNHVEEFKTLPTKNRYDGFLNNNLSLVHSHKDLHDVYPEGENKYGWSQSRKANIGMFDFNRINVRVAGDSRMRAGSVVEIDIPSNEPHDTNDTEWKKEYDSGRYMATAVRHVIAMGDSKEYTCVLELSRDSYPTQIPDQSTFLGTSNNSPEGENEFFEE